ncbi:MAG TPA: hypothetical protein VM222_02045 [Planctomycetota bacterium]|nr:hypothetical protein [Planctomycetota bacterium]
MIDPEEKHRASTATRRTAVLIVLALFVALAFLGWRVLGTSRLTISAVAKPSEHRLKSPKPHPSSLRIHVTGWLDGQATLQSPHREATVVGPGPVEWRAGGDYYEPEGVLRYAPRGATVGQLTVEYRFD